MSTKRLSIAIVVFLLLSVWQPLFAFDFYLMAPTGQILFYEIENNSVKVVAPVINTYGEYSWGDYLKPAGVVAIPDSVTNNGTTYAVKTIESKAFYSCTEVTFITMPNHITHIGDLAFAMCHFATINLPDSLQTIGYSAFHGCNLLTHVTFPDATVSIGSQMFSSCIHLSSVTFGSGCETIGVSPFDGLEPITDITCRSTTPPIIQGFLNVSSGVSLHVPCSTMSAYQSANGWGNFFTSIQEMSCTSNVTVSSGDSGYGQVNGGGTYTIGDTIILTATPNHGYRFVRWSDGDTSNPRTLIVLQDTSLAAFFELNTPDTVFVHDTTIIHYYQYDTTVVNIFDTIINNYYQYDTTIVNVFDTVIRNIYQYDTTIVNNYVYDTSIYNHYRYDTTLVFDTMIVNVYTYDTSIYNNYRFDTVILNTYQYDTTLVNVYDTIINNYYQYDTTIVFDTTIINIFDTTIVNNYQYDTIIINNYVYDTVIINNYTHDTVNNYYHDTVNNYFYDTVVISHYYHDTVIINNYVYDTIYLYKYLHDTIYIHDTIYVDSNDVEDVKTVEARIFQRDGQIVVELDEGSESLDVQVYDAVGRLLATRQGVGIHGGTPLHFDVPAAGAYLVRIGNHPARRIVIVR